MWLNCIELIGILRPIIQISRKYCHVVKIPSSYMMYINYANLLPTASPAIRRQHSVKLLLTVFVLYLTHWKTIFDFMLLWNGGFLLSKLTTLQELFFLLLLYFFKKFWNPVEIRTWFCFHGRLQLIRGVWRASKFSVFKTNWNCSFVSLLYHPFWGQLDLALFGHYVSTF